MHKKIYFSFFFIGLNTAFFLFREVYLPIKILYTFFNVFIAFRAIYLTAENKCCFSNNILLGKYYIYIISLLVSITVSFNFFIMNFISSFPIFLLLLTFIKKPNELEYKSFILGFKISMIINFIYVGFEMLFLYRYNISINNHLFSYFGITNVHDQTRSFRISGLIWDPFLLGIFCATSFFIFKNKLFKLYILIVLYYSGSRSGQLALIIALIYYYFPYFIDYKRILLLFIITIITLIYSPIFLNNTRFSNIGASTSAGERRRIEYFTLIPKIWQSDDSLLKILFGGAPMYTGARFYYTSVDNTANRIENRDNWLIESDWSGILLGRGIIGFIYYLYIFLIIILYQKNRILKTLSIAIFFAGAGYNYDLAIFTNYILFFSSSFNIGKNII